jgi:hypothetical protein
MKPKVYIETTIPSYYYGERASIQADILRTREWWDHERRHYECVTSLVTLAELRLGRHELREKRVALLDSLPLLEVTDEVLALAVVYRKHRLMPAPPSVDAVHVALATHYTMNVLLTWNCRHLANENKAQHLAMINSRLGYASPRLLTPHQLRLPEAAQ